MSTHETAHRHALPPWQPDDAAEDSRAPHRADRPDQTGPLDAGTRAAVPVVSAGSAAAEPAAPPPGGTMHAARPPDAIVHPRAVRIAEARGPTSAGDAGAATRPTPPGSGTTGTARVAGLAEAGGVAAGGGAGRRAGRVRRGRVESVGRVASEVSTMIGRSLRLGRRNLETLIMAMLLPLMIMTLFVYVFGGAIDRTGGYVDYVVPGIVLLCVGFGAASTAVPVAADMNEGMIDRLRSLPIHPAAMLAGHVVASVVRNAVSTVIVVVAAIAMGFRPDASALEWLALAGLLLLYVLALSWFAAGVGTVARNAESAGMAGFFMLFLPYLSSAFVDPSTMPGPLRVISEHQPITPVTETARGLLTGTPIGNDAWLAVAWSLGLLLASVVAATTLYRRRSLR